MCQLIYVSKNKFAVKEETLIAVGTLEEAVAYLVDVHHIKHDAIIEAITNFEERGHNYADFGVYGGMTFSMSRTVALIQGDVHVGEAVA